MPTVRDHSVKPRALVQLTTCSIGFISRCGFSTSRRRPRAGPTPRSRIARLVPALTETIERIRWRLWHGQVRRALDLLGETIAIVDAPADDTAAAGKVTRLLGDLETYVSGQSAIIIDYATARRCEEPISTAITESTVQMAAASARCRIVDDDSGLS